MTSEERDLSGHRHRISKTHPIFGDDHQALDDDAIIQFGDQFANASLMLTRDGDRWKQVPIEWVYRSVKDVCLDEDDMDCHDYIFRRRLTDED